MRPAAPRIFVQLMPTFGGFVVAGPEKVESLGSSFRSDGSHGDEALFVRNAMVMTHFRRDRICCLFRGENSFLLISRIDFKAFTPSGSGQERT